MNRGTTNKLLLKAYNWFYAEELAHETNPNWDKRIICVLSPNTFYEESVSGRYRSSPVWNWGRIKAISRRIWAWLKSL